MGLGQFYIFPVLAGYFILVLGGFFLFAYQKKNIMMLRILRVLLVIVTIVGFINIFSDDMVFQDAQNWLLDVYKDGIDDD